MICEYCKRELPENAVSCSNCGKTLKNKDGANIAENQQVHNVRKINTVPNNSASTNQNVNNNKKTGLIAIICAVAAMVAVGIVIIAVVAIVLINRITVNNKIGKIEDAIIRIESMSESEIANLYDEYEALSNGNKRKVLNREKLVNAYTAIEQLIVERKNNAAVVDELIRNIDDKNIYAKASSVIDAAIAYNKLDDVTKEYCQLFEELQDAYNDVKDLNITVTESNFDDLFVIEYIVGDRTNYGEGFTSSQDGYYIDWDDYGGTITPSYDTSVYNDYATPVYFRVAARYPNLASECSFHINLHQTYTGLGLIDSDIHEFELQEQDVKYDSDNGIVEYCIFVENNDASHSIWSWLGESYDWSDAFHKMNEFDVSRVESSNVNGTVTYK